MDRGPDSTAKLAFTTELWNENRRLRNALRLILNGWRRIQNPDAVTKDFMKLVEEALRGDN